jgi:cytochrome c oxidase subunit II
MPFRADDKPRPCDASRRVPAPGNFRCAVRSCMVLLLVFATLLLTGCQGERVQSALHPAGPAAERIAWLWWFLFFVCTPIFIIVVVLMLMGIFRRPRGERAHPPLGERFVIIAGVIVPAIVLVVMLVVSLDTILALNATSQGLTVQRDGNPNSSSDALTIRMTGFRWWWEVDYPDHGIRDANELHIPVGEPVRLELLSADVIHSFWVPELHGKMDMIPGLTNIFWIQADRPGVYRGQCAEFCGVQHALMAFMLVATPREEFDEWIAERQRPTPEPDTPELRLGHQVFVDGGCSKCHAIRGTEFRGRIGPDLTHIGSRLTIGAGWLENNHGNLSGWTVNPQAIKPGNLMPRTFLEPNELHALVAYMESLR